MRWMRGGMKIELRGRESCPSAGRRCSRARGRGRRHPARGRNPRHRLASPCRSCSACRNRRVLYRLQMIRVDTCGGGKEREDRWPTAPTTAAGTSPASRRQSDAAGRARALSLGHLLHVARPWPVTHRRPAVEPARLAQEGRPRRHRVPPPIDPGPTSARS